MTTVSSVVWIAWVIAGLAILHNMATSPGRRPVRWGVFGAVTFLIALIAILIAGRSDEFQPQET